MVVYIRPSDPERRRDRVERDIAARVAMYRLLKSQRGHCGLDAAEADRELRQALSDRAAQANAPHGTVFLERVPAGRDDFIWIVGEDREEIYLGPRADYPEPGVDA